MVRGLHAIRRTTSSNSSPPATGGVTQANFVLLRRPGLPCARCTSRIQEPAGNDPEARAGFPSACPRRRSSELAWARRLQDVPSGDVNWICQSCLFLELSHKINEATGDQPDSISVVNYNEYSSPRATGRSTDSKIRSFPPFNSISVVNYNEYLPVHVMGSA